MTKADFDLDFFLDDEVLDDEELESDMDEDEEDDSFDVEDEEDDEGESEINDAPFDEDEDDAFEDEEDAEEEDDEPQRSYLLPHQQEMLHTIDRFEERAWSEVATAISTGFAGLDKALDGGWQTGWILVGGDSNIGKTAFLSQLAWMTATKNKHVYVMDFSLDDPMHDKIPRVVAAANKVLINAVRNPQAYKHLPDMLKRRKKGLEMLRKAVDRYRCYDANFSTDIDKIEEEIKRILVLLQQEAELSGKPPRRLVVFIDNFHDLSTSAKEAQSSDKNKYDYLAQRISDMATRYNIPIITTGEFKKLNGYRRPHVDDLRESVKIKYEAKAILLCYNEVSIKGEAAAVYFEQPGKAEKCPVFEVKFGKNKFGSFKGRLFFEFYPEIAYFEEADANAAKRYNNAIYANE